MNSKPPTIKSFLLRFTLTTLILLIFFTGVQSFALGNSNSGTILTTLNGADFDLAKLAVSVLSWVMAIFASLLWVISRLMSFVFKFLGGLTYGFFINNPLDTELSAIRPLWSFLVDFGNLIVIGSFIALALVILFDIDLPVSKDLGKFASGIVMVALLLNFSLTFTSAFATTIHNIGIGSVYATIATTGSRLDLTSRAAFQNSLQKTGDKFFDTINNNFVDSVSCMGTASVVFKDGTTKGMAEICQIHKPEETGILNPVKLVKMVDGSNEAFIFYMIVLVRELATIILLGCAIWVLIILLKVSIFRLAYLWIVGIFAGPALVAAFSPFNGLKKYFETWLKWLVTFSTMMIVFVYGFYLSSYVAAVKLENPALTFEKAPNPLSEPSLFISSMVNTFVAIVVPNIMFPIIGLAILYLLGKYLDTTYKEHAEKAIKAGGKLVSDARSNTVGALKAGGGLVGKVAGGAAIGSLGYGALAKGSRALAGASRLAGQGNLAKTFDSAAIRNTGKAVIEKQKRENMNKRINNFVTGADMKEKKAENEYLAKMNNREILAGLGANTSAFTAEAKKAKVKDSVIRQGITAAADIRRNGVAGRNISDVIMEKERELVKSRRSDQFNQTFRETQNAMLQNAKAQQNEIAQARTDNTKKADTVRDREIASIQATRDKGGLTADQENQLKRREDKNEAEYQKSLAAAEGMYNKAKKDIDQLTLNIQSDAKNVVSNSVTQSIIREDPSLKAQAASEANIEFTQHINNTRNIRQRNDEAQNKYTSIEASASAIYQQMKDIQNNPTESREKKNNRINALKNSLPPDQQEVARIADRKFKDYNSNMYSDE
jgi:hypothetical protein